MNWTFKKGKKEYNSRKEQKLNEEEEEEPERRIPQECSVNDRIRARDEWRVQCKRFILNTHTHSAHHT